MAKQKKLGLQNWLDVMTTNFFQFEEEGGAVSVDLSTDNQVLVILKNVTIKNNRLVIANALQAEQVAT